MSKKLNQMEFTPEQIEQIDKIRVATENLLKALLVTPEYLKESKLQGLSADDELPINPFEIADSVAQRICCRPGVQNIFFPTHFEDRNGEEYVADLYNENEIYNED